MLRNEVSGITKTNVFVDNEVCFFCNQLNISNFNVRKQELHGETGITKEHVKNNADVRKLLLKSRIKPENLFPEEDIKKLERKG
jgi:hypothetical protein